MTQGFIAHDSGNLAQQQDADGRVRDAPRGNFKLFVHPRDWVIDHRGKLMPVVAHISKEVGAGSVTRRGDFSQRELEHIKNGYIPVPHDILGDRDYLDLYFNEKGRKVYRTCFQVPDHGPDGETIWQHDEEAYDKFIALLRQKGIVKPPAVSVVKGLLNAKQWLYADKARRGPRNTTTEATERYEREMAALRQTIAMLEGELAQSEAHYGPEHSSVTELLDNLLSPVEDETQAKPKRTRAPRKKGPAFVAHRPEQAPAEDEDEAEVDV